MSKKAAKKSKAPVKKSKAVKKKASKKAPAKKSPAKAVKKKAVKKAVAKPAKPAPKKAAKPKAPKTQPPLITAIINGLEERKAKNITVLDLRNIEGRSFDFFVIADADSGTHVESIAASVEDLVKKEASERPFHTEGWQNAEWILLDYINVVVHVFQRPVREFYNLEGLWADAEVQNIN